MDFFSHGEARRTNFIKLIKAQRDDGNSEQECDLLLVLKIDSVNLRKCDILFSYY